jgi:hypothetical protein
LTGRISRKQVSPCLLWASRPQDLPPKAIARDEGVKNPAHFLHLLPSCVLVPVPAPMNDGMRKQYVFKGSVFEAGSGDRLNSLLHQEVVGP